MKQLSEKHDSILIATGVYKPREVNITGSHLKNIFPAMELLTASNRKGLGDKVEMFDNGILDAKEKDIIVIGCGDTSMDWYRTSIIQNEKDVKWGKRIRHPSVMDLIKLDDVVEKIDNYFSDNSI